MAKGLGSVTEMVIQGIFPWCFTPELYAAKPEYIDPLAAFVSGRPKQPLDAFLRQSDAVIATTRSAQLGRIKAPTQITFGRHDIVTSTRFAEAMKSGIGGASWWSSRAAPMPRSTRTWANSTARRWRSCSARPGKGIGAPAVIHWDGKTEALRRFRTGRPARPGCGRPIRPLATFTAKSTYWVPQPFKVLPPNTDKPFLPPN